jgi:hypothetical protein
MVLTCLGLVVSNPALAATTHHSEGSLVAHALTSNPTCTTLMEAGGSDEVTGCVQASPTGLTFSWTGYNGFAFANQGIAYVGNGASNSEQFSCSIPTCIRFVPLASGEYSGVVTVVTGGCDQYGEHFKTAADVIRPASASLSIKTNLSNKLSDCARSDESESSLNPTCHPPGTLDVF